ncbi:MAG: hypothetical protein ACJAW3_000039 [Lentimonas sp.]|jgi:hypothetical protein
MSRFTIFNNLHRFFISGFLLLFACQIAFWFKAEKIKPNIHIVPKAPSAQLVKISSFGDSQFYFRLNALKIENAGDSFGRFTPLKNYNYQDLYNWFKILDGLDSQSKYVPSLAANYYSMTQNKPDTKYIVQYLDEYASRDIDKNWWWLYQALYIAKNTLKDQDLALQLAYKLSENNNPNAPFWTKQFPAFIKADMGDDCGAFLVIKDILQDASASKISVEEMDFMRYFIGKRISALKEKNFDPRKCQIKK